MSLLKFCKPLIFIDLWLLAEPIKKSMTYEDVCHAMGYGKTTSVQEDARSRLHRPS